MTKYLRIYGNIALVAIIAGVAILFASTFVAMATNWFPLGSRIAVSSHSGLIASLLRLAILLIAGFVVWFLVRDRRWALDEADLWENGDDDKIELYRGFTQDVGVEPAVARRVIEATTGMSDEDRSLDFHRANLPNFAAELGYRLGIDGKTREMMKEFFETNRDSDTRRSFHVSSRLTMEGDHIEQTHDAKAEVEPVSRYAPRDPASDPNWSGEITRQELHTKIFGGWDDLSSEEDGTLADGGNNDDSPVFVIPEEEQPDLVKSELPMVASLDDGDFESSPDNEIPVWEDEDEIAGEIVGDELSVDSGWGDDAVVLDVDFALDDNDDDNDADEGEPDDDDAATFDDQEIFAYVQKDPVIAGLMHSIELTRRLPKMSDLRYLFGLYGSDIPSLVAEFSAPSITHVEQMGPTVEPLFNHAGVRRHETPAWIVELGDRPAREDDLNAVVWIPIGLARLGDLKDRQAWKLVPVAGGTSVPFYALRPDMPLVAARLEWILWNLYGDMDILQDDGQTKTFYIPSLGVTIDLMITEALTHGDSDIHGDTDKVAGPELTELCDVSIFSDGGRKWFSSRLEMDEIEHPDWLAVFTLVVTLCMRTEPVTSKELLGQWATTDSGRGKQLIEMLKKIFGGRLKGDSEGWVLSNVRLDLFWLEDYLKDDAPSDAWTNSVRDFFVRKFEAGSLDWILNLGSMDPKTRTSDLIQMEKLLRYVLSEAVDLFGPDAEGELARKFDSIAAMIGKDS